MSVNRIYVRWLLAGMIAASAVATPVLFWDLADRTQDGQLTMFNPSAEDGTTGIPVNAGDIDGDGYTDAVISAMTGDGRMNNKPSCGEVHVLFGVDTIRGLVDFADYNGVHENLLTVWGRARKDYFGSNADVEDFDGDGTNDLMISAMWADTLGRTDCGSVYIIWGGPQLRNTFIDVADTADMNQYQITTIVGREADDKFGAWICCGDANGDGFEDALIGAPRANGFANDQQHDQTGEAYLLFGPFEREQHIDLANTNHPMTVIYGVDPNDQMGNTVMVADINGDDLEDLVLGAGAFSVARLGDTDADYPFETGGGGDGPDNDRPEAGELYILPGRINWPAEIDLAAGMPAGSTVIYGAHGNEGPETGGDNFGEEIMAADVNGDGIPDLSVGAFRADGLNNDRFWAGNSYLFYGRHNWPAVIDLLDGLPDSTTVIFGGGVDWIVGDSAPLADINNDGFFDILACGSHDGGPYGIYKAGTIRIIYGGPDLLPQVIDLGNPPAGMEIPIIQASEESDLLAYWCTTGDFNNDGYWDIIPNVMHGDGPNNERHNAGDFHVISGEWITNHPGQPRYLSAEVSGDDVILNWFDNGEEGTDSHVIYRRFADSTAYDSIGHAPFPLHTFTDTNVPGNGSYVYRIKARSAAGIYSNYSNEAAATLGLAIGNDIPLVVNGIHWGFFGNEADDFWNDRVLTDNDTFDFWDLYFTNNYPSGIEPIGYGTDSLDEAIFNSRQVIWALNGFDPDNANYNDGNVLLDFGPVLTAYLQNGGELIVVGKEMDIYLPTEIEGSYFHVVGWGFHNTITGTNGLLPYYNGLLPIGKRSGAPNITSIPPMSFDVSGLSRPLYFFQEGSMEWMGAISRGYEDMWYQTALLSIRPYRANPAQLQDFMTILRRDLLGHYASPAGLAATTNGSQIELSWDAPVPDNVTGHFVMRQPVQGGAYDTIAFVNTPATSYADTPPAPYSTYNYWIVSAHSNGRTSLPSDTVEGFAPGPALNGSMLIVNGVDWATYGPEVTNMYNNHVLQGNRPFRFWDLFSTQTYPPGYTPIGYGTDSLVSALWSTQTVVWAFNGFNGDELALAEMSPLLDLYLNSGGNVLLVGKDLHTYLPAELTQRAMINTWLAPVDWTATDTARGEHPVMTDFGKITGSTMSLCPEFTLESSPLSFPLFRKSLSTAGYIAAAARETEASRLNLILISVRPYRAEPIAFRATMDSLLSDFLGHTLAEPVDDLTVYRVSQNLTLRWSAIPGAISYRVTRRLDLTLPTNRASVAAVVAGTSWVDPNPINTAPAKAFYVVFPVFP